MLINRAQGEQHARRRRVRGLTLIEALAATVLLGVGVVGLMSSATLGLRNQQRCEHRTAAVYLAEELMNQVAMIGPHIWTLGQPAKGVEARGNVDFEWEVAIESLTAGELFDVQVAVTWQTATDSGTVKLATLLNDYEAVQLGVDELPSDRQPVAQER
ncbi:MAG: hypothetical protein GXY33_22455 [Phycisphaerae bacterium]|nr:hypothetical protein [Phycisphaerae bacterium]